ncbi:hypothetical protein [[Eubacterium] cellulosolvens]
MRPYRFVLIMASIAILVNLFGVLQYGIASYFIIGLAIGIIILVGSLMFRIRRRFLKDFIIVFFTGGITLSLASLVYTVQLIGATHFGYPFQWLTYLVLAPEHYPWRFNPDSFFLNWILYGIISGIVLVIIRWLRRITKKK